MSLFKKIRRIWRRDPSKTKFPVSKANTAPPPRFVSIAANLAPKIPADSPDCEFAPIAVFCYRRPDHLRRCLKAVHANTLAAHSTLFIFCDGAKSAEDAEAVAQTREVARSRSWCGQVHVIESPENKGLSRSITDGVTRLCEQFGQVIVIEDDLTLSRSFLDFMNAGLEKYRDDPRVAQISGHLFPTAFPPPPRAYFLPLVTTWGWATWQREWRDFSNDSSRLDLKKIDEATWQAFDLGGNYAFSKMLRKRVAGRNDSWGVLWWWQVFRAGGLTLYPPRSLVKNTGLDGSGTHCREHGTEAPNYDFDLFHGEVEMPRTVAANEPAFAALKQYLSKFP